MSPEWAAFGVGDGIMAGRKTSSSNPVPHGPDGADKTVSDNSKKVKDNSKTVSVDSNTVQNVPKKSKTDARTLTQSDWLLIRYSVSAEGMTCAQVARAFNVNHTTIRARAKKERWHDIDQIRNLPTTEELIIMRNQSEIIRTLKAMNRKLESAMDSNDPDALKTALSKAELLGRHARATQSLARASEVAASSKRKVKAHAKPVSDPERDRQALADQLAQIDEKLERAKLPEQSERG